MHAQVRSPRGQQPQYQVIALQPAIGYALVVEANLRQRAPAEKRLRRQEITPLPDLRRLNGCEWVQPPIATEWLPREHVDQCS